MRRKSTKELIALGTLKGLIIFGILLFFTVSSGFIAYAKEDYSSEIASADQTFEELNPSEVTTEWDDEYLFSSREEALKELESLKKGSEEINETFRPEFGNLSGPVLLNYIETEKEFSRSIDILYIYAYTQLSKNVNDQFFSSLLADTQDLATEHGKAVAFAAVKLTSLSTEEWEQLFSDEPGLEIYRSYLEASYIRFGEHRPENESQVAYLADIENQRMKLQTEAVSQITNNVTMAGNITLENGEEFSVNSQSYATLISTDPSQENRKRCYEKRFYHLINQSDSMASLYSEKSQLDDLAAKELNYNDSYEKCLYNLYLTDFQVNDMNSVFKGRKDIFEGYNDFRKEKLRLETLKPYDLALELTEEPGKEYTYVDVLKNTQKSYAGMDSCFNNIFLEMATGNFIDVYPDPENGKQPGGYCYGLSALQAPALIFMNYNGLISDQKTLTHELGHGIHFYLMGNSVDYLYCTATTYEMEIPSTFNEELFVDYVVENSDRDTAVAVLSQHIGEYQNYFSFQPMITEFEHKAHQLCAEKDHENGTVSGAEFNALWTELYKDYRSDSIEYYSENSAEWTYISHIYLENNYYTFNYAVSKAITLALFKQYREDPETFNENYIAYLSAGSTMTPEEKLKKYFGIEIDRQLFEDAMDVVELRIQQLEELNSGEEEPKFESAVESLNVYSGSFWSLQLLK
ncbi:M3 family oligoendopeptidase [Methanosarcina soligelidi]|uniref:M3 family oligoendopeptidase n=1 Tax=Methanosarcina soligelidi TaxID=1036677 RepID=UPI000A063A69|nr:M3 family oligoendopeptidase [Methanosarcina soligelidi]